MKCFGLRGASFRGVLVGLTMCLWSAVSAQETPDKFHLMPEISTALAAGEIPVYETSLKGLPQHAATHEVEVVVEFPEYAPLSRREVRQLKRMGYVPTTMVKPEWWVGSSRGETMLDVRLTPIVCQKGRWRRLVSGKLTVRHTSFSATRNRPVTSRSTERYARQSVLHTGRWIKISVPAEGIYQLTHTQLSNMGFKDPARVKLFGYGGTLLPEVLPFADGQLPTDDLQEVPLFRRSDAVLFFSHGVERWEWDTRRKAWQHVPNLYTTESYYFLTEGDAPLALSQDEVKAAIATDTTLCSGRALREHDVFSWYQGGRLFFDSQDLSAVSSQTFKLPTPGITNSHPSALTIAVGAAASSRSTTVQPQVNGATLARFSVPAISTSVGDARVRQTLYSVPLTAEETSVKLAASGDASSRLDFIRISYPRRLDARQDAYFFSYPDVTSPLRLHIAGANAHTQVWRLGTNESPMAEMQGTLQGDRLEVVVAGGNERYVIVNTQATYPSPKMVGEVSNQNLHADGALDMVIITPPSGMLNEEAERLAEAHRSLQGLRVKVVQADLIYNEFSSGSPDATAIRRYLKMLYDRAATMDDAPRYLLLFGDCANDNRMQTEEWKGFSPKDFLPSYEANGNDSIVGTIYSYVTDDYFGLLDDGEGTNIVNEKVDLGIGRFPCHDAASAAILVNKAISYMRGEHVGNWKNKVCLLGDDGDYNEHMNDAENVAKTITSASQGRIDLKKVYWDAYPPTITATGFRCPEATEILRETMTKGTVMMNYSGHGDPRQLSKSRILALEDFATYASPNMMLWVLASCEISPYDTQIDNISRTALINKAGGAIAFMCASRAVYASYNNSLNTAFCKYVLGSDAQGRRYTMGDAMRLAKNEMVTGSDRTMNKMKYALLGDPALTLAIPTGELVIDSINDQTLSAGEIITLKAGELVRFSGRALTSSKETDTDFTGLLTATLYDRERDVVCKNNKNSGSAFVYQDRGTPLIQGNDSVVSGRFSFNMIIPYNISYSSDAARLSLYAVSEDKRKENSGICERFCLNGTAELVQPDTLSPQVYVYLNQPDFPDGGTVGTSALFVAEISDDFGINTTAGNSGREMELSIDNGTNVYTLNENFSFDAGSYKQGRATFELTGLNAGRHTLSFKVWDVNGNSTMKYLKFNVGDAPQSFEVVATENPAQVSTTFITYLPQEEMLDGCSVTNEVYNLSGQLMWSNTTTHETPVNYSSIQWNLTQSTGNPLPGGLYLYRSKVKWNGGEKETEAKKLIIQRY